MKHLITGLALINGLWMLADGIHVMLAGKYIGPEKPGPWASLIGLMGIDVFKLGPVFVTFGLAWLVFAGAMFGEVDWARPFGLIVAALTLWYLPVGTVISIFVLIVLGFFIKA